ncbi:MAG: hypothetical protein WA949_20580 [Phormidesmis sp.]
MNRCCGIWQYLCWPLRAIAEPVFSAYWVYEAIAQSDGNFFE